MKRIKLLILSSIFIGATSCEKYLDVNDNPNATSEASIALVLPAAQASTTINVGGTLYNLGGLWSQYYTQSPDAGQYENIDSYNIASDFYDGTWQELYAGALRDYKYIMDQSLEDGNTAYYLVAASMRAYTYQVLVDLYGAVPYAEALQGDNGNITPAYSDGKDVYEALLTSLDFAISEYESNPAGPNPSTNDLIFSGNMTSWVQFATTLKLKMLMRANGQLDPSGTKILDLVNNGNLLSADAKMVSFENLEGKRNPFYDVIVDRLGGVNHAASNTMIKYLVANDDARITAMYKKADDGTYTAKEQGDFENRDIRYQNLAKPIFTATMPVYLFSASEVSFLKAEALERFAGGAGAQAAYEEGVQRSFTQRGMTDTAATYISGVYAYNTGGSSEDRIKQIMTQKWVSMTGTQNLEAFFELTRTGYPAYQPNGSAQPGDLTISIASVLPGTQTPKRLLFPNISSSRNPNVPAQPAGGLAAPVFWAQ